MKIAVDLDKTLAHADDKDDYDPAVIGKPIGPMMDRVKGWLKDGHQVVIHTARASEPGSFPHIKKWLREQGLPDLPITSTKAKDIDQFWDDKAVAVEPNTGKVLGGDTGEKSWEDEARETLK